MTAAVKIVRQDEHGSTGSVHRGYPYQPLIVPFNKVDAVRDALLRHAGWVGRHDPALAASLRILAKQLK